MIYSVNFLDLAEKINPISFSKYLDATGWTEYNSKRNDVKIFQLENNINFFQVNIPMDRKLRDYKQAMYEAVETVSIVENKSLEQVMLYLLNPNTDILKIRLEKEDVEAGNILLDDAIRLYENVKKMLAATVLDILHPKRYHQGRIDDAVTKFLSNCKFGQTEIGSYVISVVCPFAELDDKGYKQLSIFSDEEQCADSLTRKVTSKVINNIVEIKNRIDSGNMDDLVSKENENKISANFYEALNGLNLDSDGANVEFIAEWSPTVGNTNCLESKITLTHDYYQPIESVITKLKDNKNEFTNIIGKIKKLESSPDVDKRTTGRVTIVYLDDNDDKKTVIADLDKDDYDKAIEAHASGKHIEIVGNLKKARRSTITCESFAIIN